MKGLLLQYVATLLLCVDHMHANFLGLRMGSGEFVCIFKLRPLFDCSQNRFVCDASGFCYDSSRRFWAVPASLLPRPERPSCGAVGRPTHLHCGSVLPQVPGGEKACPVLYDSSLLTTVSGVAYFVGFLVSSKLRY